MIGCWESGNISSIHISYDHEYIRHVFMIWYNNTELQKEIFETIACCIYLRQPTEQMYADQYNMKWNRTILIGLEFDIY